MCLSEGEILVMNFTVRKAGIGKNSNYIELEVSIPSCGNRRYQVTFYGGGIDTTAPLTDEQQEEMKKRLQDIYGMPPFSDEL